ncbi:MAG: sugar kinase, partial [Terrimicrobiaceae bacterium]|nr:sugar kinase [Terrimicrobiaceae bacterium]
MLCWGIDLGGTKIEGGILDPSQPGSPILRRRMPTEASGGFDHIVSRIAALVAELERETGLQRPPVIGMGTPGATEPSTGLLKNSNTTCLN